MLKQILHCAILFIFALCVVGVHTAQATTDTTFYVGARTGSDLHTLAAHTFDTGVSIKAGHQLSVMVNENARWSVQTQSAGWRITADGKPDTPITLSDAIIGGGTFNAGTLVGYIIGDDGITNTGYLGIGTAGLIWDATFDGTLHMLCWDSYYANNFHGLTTSISVTPIPGAVWLLGSGLIGLVGIRRRKTA